MELAVKLSKKCFHTRYGYFWSKGIRLFLIFNLSYVFAAFLTFINSTMKDEKQRENFWRRVPFSKRLGHSTGFNAKKNDSGES